MFELHHGCKFLVAVSINTQLQYMTVQNKITGKLFDRLWKKTEHYGKLSGRILIRNKIIFLFVVMNCKGLNCICIFFFFYKS